ncbi:MAG: HU family DNA-binding protein [Acidiferrobacterales bacterium]|nr:HU family DNA-binding protein [Acidiferrobacterales bacterium]
MNKTEMVSNVADSTGLTKADAGRAVEAVFDQIKSSLKNHDSVAIIGFGTFSTGHRAARTGRNPRDGSEVSIPASTVVKFKAGKALKDAVN